MSNNVVPTPNAPKRRGKGVTPQWDETTMRRRTQLLYFAAIGLVIGIWIFLLIWVLFLANIQQIQVQKLVAGVDLTLVLAPVLAAATGVERLLETIFNTLEGVWRTGVAYLGAGMRWLKSAETEVAEARDWLQSAGAIYNGVLAANNQKMKALLEEAHAAGPIAAIPDQLQEAVTKLQQQADEKTLAAKALLDDAQQRLSGAQDKLASVTSDPDYRSAKGAATIIIGLMLGLIVAAIGQIQMFALLGISTVPPRLDVLITGLVIGSGAYPVHSLVGILQQSKDALDSLGNLMNRSRTSPAPQTETAKPDTVQPAQPPAQP